HGSNSPWGVTVESISSASRLYSLQGPCASKSFMADSTLIDILPVVRPDPKRSLVHSRRAACVLIALATLSFARTVAAQNADVIRGRVITVDSQPIPNTTVTVTTISGGVNRSAKTDRNGRYTITFPNGDGDYLVKFVALGYSPRQYELKRAADEDILVANA